MKKNQILLAALCVAAFASGCGKNETADNSGAGNAAAPAKKLKLAFVSNNAANFWTIARAGCNDAAKELGDVDVDFRIPSTPDAAAQQEILNDLVARGEDGIAISPNNPENQTDFLNKIAGQTLLITTDSDAPASKRVAYIGTDNEAAGEQAGQLIKEVLPNGGKIMLFVGFADAQNAKDRLAGIKKALDGSTVQIVDVRTDDADQVRAQKNAEDTLVKYPDISCLVGLYSYNGPAILNAVRNAGKIGQVKIVCFDDDQDTLSGIASGGIYGTVVQQPYEFGKQAITRMDKYLHGDKSTLAGDKIFVSTIPVTKANVAEIQAKEKQLLGQ
ncbi:MAG TPA: sugar-binding protein [Verrucomicrobiae bacterium]|jgi:ribose transport system substrate-binding protein